MKYLLTLLLLTQLSFANEQFSSEERSVFTQNENKEQRVQDREIVTFEQQSDDNTALQEQTQTNPIQTQQVQLEQTPQIQTQQTKPTSIEDTPIQTDEELKAAQLKIDEINEKRKQDLIKLHNVAQSMQEESSSDDNLQLNVQESELSLEESVEEELSLEEQIELELDSTDYFEKFEFTNASRAKSIYLSYPSYPKEIYKNQRFEVTVKALVTTDDFYKVESRFIDSKNMTVLNPESVWVLKDTNSFENTYYFKATDSDFVMPTFQILLYKGDRVVEVEYIKPQELNFRAIGKDDEKFSSIIAKELTINAYKTKQYNNNELITILDISATESNLEDFKLKYVEEQGFSKIEDNYPEQKMLYYLVLPIHNKKIEFNYYNTTKKGFQKISIPILLANELVSTQTDLNPNNSNLLLYKKIALGVLAAVLLALFIWKRQYIYLILLLINVIVLIIYLMPNRQAYIKGGTTIYILPTKNSTIFYETKQSRVVQVDMKKAGFIKIIMNIENKKIIGWIKEDRLVTN